jgi:hypothetical protein
MAIKTFTTGEVLTASDTNTYLANAGLVFVKQQTVGSAVSSVTVSDAFNSTYDAYKIVMAGGSSSADCNLQLKLGASTTGYYSAGAIIVYSTAASFFACDNNATSWTQAGYSIASNGYGGSIELVNPFLAKYTYIQNLVAGVTAGGQRTGVHQVATSYDAFTITPDTGTLTGGTITVYGYRKG